MIYITGDTHTEFSRFSMGNFPEQKEMTKADYVIILGDFGGIWSADPENRKENEWLDWLNRRSFTTLFIDGNHENFDRLGAFPVRNWNGGKVHVIRPSILHLMRGQVFRIGGKTFFTFGGANSYDKPYRTNHVNWWEQEMPSKEEMREGTMNLQATGWEVDYILTHCLPSSLHRGVSGGLFKTNALTDYLEYVRDMCTYRYWYCSHYHWERDINERDKVIYESIRRIE